MTMWKCGKKWVYSITYDEGCAALLDNALPVHRKYGVPGHVALVSREVGKPRQAAGSSYEGWMILSRDEVRMLVREGWGISCHGMTHDSITPENAEYEVVEARKVLEEAVGLPVNMFCVPNNQTCYPAARAVAERAGYGSIMTIVDDINSADTDLFSLNRCPLHTQYPPPFFSAYDPYKRIHQAIDAGGWIVDYCHCPMPGKPVHPWKDCTLEQLEERFATVCRMGGNDVWLAEPNEVVQYILSLR